MEWHDFKEGETYRAEFQDGCGSKKIHIVKVINEGLSFAPMIVYRFFGSHKQWWHYQIKSAYMLTADIPSLKTS